jgi:DNA modification methylase
MTDSQFTGLLSASLGQLERVMTPGAIGHICMDWRHMANMTSAIQTAGLELINLCVWDKTTPGMGSLYRSQHELVFVVKKPGAPHQNMVELGRNGRNRSNVWAYEGVIGAGVDKARERAMHPTVKPLALVKDAILDCTKKGDVVLDLFGGSGTTLIAAEKTGRRARLMELDPKYADVIIRRWQGFTGKAAVHHQSGRSFDDIALNGRALEDEAPAPRQRIRVRV